MIATAFKCCGECFGDRQLKKNTIPALSKESGKCHFCQTENTALIRPNELEDLFAPLISIYVEDEAGAPLVQWLRDDWGIFTHPNIDDARAIHLLAEVLANYDITKKNFSPSPRYLGDGLQQWEELRNELMYTNRFFPDKKIDTDRMTSLLPGLVADDLPDQWYRARLHQGDAGYTIEQMGPPPKRIASHGRANPPGIPYLYLGSTEETSISEVRPHTGEIASIADFTLGEGLKMVDLRDPRSLLSPFVYGDEDQIGALRTDLPFLHRLGEELTRPVLPQGAAIDYVPSQYLCELIKKSGYDGVIYRSSVSDGMNLALFNPDRAAPGAINVRTVAKVQVTLAPV